MEIGLTGWLSPEGTFYPCEYGEHSSLASEIMDTHENKLKMNQERIRICGEKGFVVSYHESLKLSMWIPMGIPKWGSQQSMDYLFIDYEIGISEQQKKWFEENYHNLSVWQQGMLDEYLEDMEFDRRRISDSNI